MTTLPKSVTLSPGASKSVAFEVTPTVAKTYSVSVDGLYGSFKAMAVVILIVGGLTVRLMCDNVGVCVKECPTLIAQGILLITPASLQFLAERNYEVWVYPNRYDPSTGQYQAVGHALAGRSQTNYCEILIWEDGGDIIVIHELGHAIDRKLGWLSEKADFQALLEQYYGAPYNGKYDGLNPVELWASYFALMHIVGTKPPGYYPDPECLPAYNYVRQVAENPWSYL